MAKKTPKRTIWTKPSKMIKTTKPTKITKPIKSSPKPFPDADTGKRARSIFRILSGEYPDARCQLDHTNALELLVATILAAQCTDKQVNMVTRTLFRKYRRAEDYLNAADAELENDIRSTGFFRNKARSLKKCCRSLVEKHGGEVPADLEALTALGGVGRKTANCVLGNVFGIPGIVVDTHVLRLSRRMGLSEEKQPDKVERDLMALLPDETWTRFSHVLADHGRSFCTARNPRCDDCPVGHICPKII
jgi:endonuclease-3